MPSGEGYHIYQEKMYLVGFNNYRMDGSIRWPSDKAVADKRVPNNWIDLGASCKQTNHHHGTCSCTELHATEWEKVKEDRSYITSIKPESNPNARYAPSDDNAIVRIVLLSLLCNRCKILFTRKLSCVSAPESEVRLWSISWLVDIELWGCISKRQLERMSLLASAEPQFDPLYVRVLNPSNWRILQACFRKRIPSRNEYGLPHVCR